MNILSLRPTARWILLAGCFLAITGCKKHSSSHTKTPDLLDAPLITRIDATDGAIDLEWTAIEGAETYNLYWATSEGFAIDQANAFRGLTATEYTHVGLEPSGTYYYAVTAVNVDGEGKVSPEVSAILPPGVVEVIWITAGDSYTQVSWTEIDSATGYDLYRSEAPGVTKENGHRFGNVGAPFVDTDVVNDRTYFYVVVAVGPGGDGPMSAEVSARPKATVGAPQNVTVTLMEETPRALVVSWDPPDSQVLPDSYNIYWDTQPGVTLTDNLIAGAESPYYHTGLTGKTTYYYIVTALIGSSESEPSVEVSGVPRGGSGGGDDGGYGNNLATPVVLADGYGILGAAIDPLADPNLDPGTGLRPTTSDVTDPFPFFDPNSIFTLNGVDHYPQQTESTWRPQWLDGSGTRQDVVVDWGDNLAAQHFSTNSVLRVETVLYQDTTGIDPPQTLTGYTMNHLFGSGVGEMWGTDGTTYDSNLRHVFAVCGRLTIEKLLGQGGDVDLSIDGFEAAVYEKFGDDGPGGYGAEVNVSGKVVYGYVWMLKSWPLTEAEKRGWWRITFSLDPSATFGTVEGLENRTFLTALDPTDTAAVLDTEANRTWMEVEIE